MRKRIFFLSLLLLVFLIMAASCTGQPVERKGPPQLSAVQDRVLVPVDLAAEKVLNLFREKPSTFSVPFDHLSAIPAGSDLFPQEAQLQAWSKRNLSLQPYVALSLNIRKHDLYLAAPTDYFWHSEYNVGNQPVLFRSDFIIHFEPEPSGSTLVQVFEHLPRIFLGKTFELTRHGPGRVNDERWVEPTVSDRVALLKIVTQILKK